MTDIPSTSKRRISTRHVAFAALALLVAAAAAAQPLGLGARLDAAEVQLEADTKACKPINTADYLPLLNEAYANVTQAAALRRTGVPLNDDLLVRDFNRAVKLYNHARDAAHAQCRQTQTSSNATQQPSTQGGLATGQQAHLNFDRSEFAHELWIQQLEKQAADLANAYTDAIKRCDKAQIAALEAQLDQLALQIDTLEYHPSESDHARYLAIKAAIQRTRKLQTPNCPAKEAAKQNPVPPDITKDLTPAQQPQQEQKDGAHGGALQPRIKQAALRLDGEKADCRPIDLEFYKRLRAEAWRRLQASNRAYNKAEFEKALDDFYDAQAVFNRAYESCKLRPAKIVAGEPTTDGDAAQPAKQLGPNLPLGGPSPYAPQQSERGPNLPLGGPNPYPPLVLPGTPSPNPGPYANPSTLPRFILNVPLTGNPNGNSNAKPNNDQPKQKQSGNPPTETQPTEAQPQHNSPGG